MTSNVLQQRAPALALGRQRTLSAVKPGSLRTRKQFLTRASTENDSYQVGAYFLVLCATHAEHCGLPACTPAAPWQLMCTQCSFVFGAGIV